MSEHEPREHLMNRPHPEMPANLESAYQRAGQVTAKHALRLESFIHPDGVSEEMVKRDLDYVENRKNNFTDQGSPEYMLAKSFEAALFERINNSQWFGERVKMIMPSEYDDHANGMDGVLEFHEQQGSKNYLGMGIDVTYNWEPGKKFEIIKEQIDEARLGTVKYFRNTDDTFEGRLKNLPRAVVILNAADATRVVRDWDENATEAEGGYRKVILRQLEMQLEAYQAYARRLEQADKRRYVISRFFAGALRNVSALLAEVAKSEELEQLNKHPNVKMVEDYLKQLGFQEPKLTRVAS